MTHRILLLVRLIIGGSFALTAAAQSPSPTTASHPAIEFDQFMLVLLVRPPNAPDFPKEEMEKLQAGHITNIHRLHDEGKMLKAGPVEDFSGRNVRGIFILTTDSQEKAREWIAGDPLIKAGRLVPEFLKWYVEKGSLK
jgi:uncharacterized protein YciI